MKELQRPIVRTVRMEQFSRYVVKNCEGKKSEPANAASDMSGNRLKIKIDRYQLEPPSEASDMMRSAQKTRCTRGEL